MKLGNEGIKLKFDDIDSRIDFLIDLCQSLQNDNQALVSKINELETELETRTKAQGEFAEQETLIETKIDGLLNKLDGFSNQFSQEDVSKG